MEKETSDYTRNVTLTLPARLVDAIDAYYHDRRLRSRSEGARQLLAMALERIEGEKGEPE